MPRTMYGETVELESHLKDIANTLPITWQALQQLPAHVLLECLAELSDVALGLSEDYWKRRNDA